MYFTTEMMKTGDRKARNVPRLRRDLQLIQRPRHIGHRDPHLARRSPIRALSEFRKLPHAGSCSGAQVHPDSVGLAGSSSGHLVNGFIIDQRHKGRVALRNVSQPIEQATARCHRAKHETRPSRGVPTTFCWGSPGFWKAP